MLPRCQPDLTPSKSPSVLSTDSRHPSSPHTLKEKSFTKLLWLERNTPKYILLQNANTSSTDHRTPPRDSFKAKQSVHVDCNMLSIKSTDGSATECYWKRLSLKLGGSYIFSTTTENVAIDEEGIPITVLSNCKPLNHNSRQRRLRLA